MQKSRNNHQQKILFKNHINDGFTIVELLVVIVVIGILAAITIVSYTGVTKKANDSVMLSDLSNNAKKLELYKVDNGIYPTSIDPSTKCPTAPNASSTTCLKTSTSTNTLTYTPAGDGLSYVLSETNTNNNATATVTNTTKPSIDKIIGEDYGGGKIAYILQPADPGYVAGIQHGLIAATSDQSSGIQWAKLANHNISISGMLETLGSGSSNTDKIITQNGAGVDYAAGLARSHNGGGYSDWYLPSKTELGKLYINRVIIGASGTYWNSSQYDSGSGYIHDFNMNIMVQSFKYGSNRVRAVRSF